MHARRSLNQELENKRRATLQIWPQCCLLSLVVSQPINQRGLLSAYGQVHVIIMIDYRSAFQNLRNLIFPPPLSLADLHTCVSWLQGLLKRYLSTATLATATALSDALLLSSAAVELLRGHSLLAEHAVDLGYVDKLLKLMASRLPADAGV